MRGFGPGDLKKRDSAVNAIQRCIVGLFIVVTVIACAPFWDVAPGSGIAPIPFGFHASGAVKGGMTKDEVRALLGSPDSFGSMDGDQWNYRETILGGSIFRVSFGPDGRVTGCQEWVQ
jgi:hypothetical protein